VVSLLTGLVQIQGFAVINAGVGIAAFGSVVVLTMLASLSFDPRLSWDSRQQQQAERELEREQPLRDNREEKPA